MPKISVIIPAYNAAATIGQTLASVLEQTFSDWEAIVIDDGSCDRTVEIVNSIGDPRLQIFSYTNAGVSVARNRGLTLATGEYIAFLDADDLWSADKLQLQLVALQQHPHAGVAYSWTQFLDATGTRLHPAQPEFIHGNVYPQLLVRNFLYCGSNALIRKSAIDLVGGFDPTLTHGEDWEFFVRLAAQVEFVVVPKSQILYRQSPVSASSQVMLMEQSVLRVIDSVFDAAPAQFQSLKNENLANLYQYLTGLYLANLNNSDEVKQVRRKLRKAIHYHPKTLFNKITQRYVLKWLLIQLLSPQGAKHFTRAINTTRAVRTQG